MRLIDGDAAYTKINKLRDADNLNGYELILLDTVLAVVKCAEAVDPVKHGHWIKRNSVGTATCSICGGLIMDFHNKDANLYCHNCGAKMDEK